jgi:cyclopropane-fatty-acyl-phospholipid synthase
MTTIAMDPPAAASAVSAWIGRPSPGAIGLAERGWLPDAVVRAGIRRLLRARLRDERTDDVEAEAARMQTLVDTWRAGPLAIDTDAANAQHYEMPADFMGVALGPRRKYSSCLYEDGDSLAVAEERMLALTCERAQLADGQSILELGCGWGSLSLWMAERYPRARIVAVSNSRRQREFINAQAAARGLINLEVITADLRSFSIERTFDRVVSVECFEHLRNHAELFRRIALWLRPAGQLFVHVFVHRTCTYAFSDGGDDDWLARHFFTGGIMPADDLFLRYQDDLALTTHWRVNGRHYARTAEDWLVNLDRGRDRALAALTEDGLPVDAARLQFRRWRIFFMSCAELWGFRGGNAWFVAHYRFVKRARS